MRLAASAHDRSHRVALRHRLPRDLGAEKPSGAGHCEAQAEGSCDRQRQHLVMVDLFTVRMARTVRMLGR
eukprot:scaffold4247_cov60-Phaeocystis_antarctica.AAC.5